MGVKGTKSYPKMGQIKELSRSQTLAWQKSGYEASEREREKSDHQFIKKSER
jgi:hypothetical protein